MKALISNKTVLLSFSACLFLAARTIAADVSDPEGLVEMDLLAGSDTIVAAPLVRSPEFSGSILAIAGDTLTIAGAPGWTDGQFVYAAGVQPETYYVVLGTGTTPNPKAGDIYAVTGNGANTLTIDLNGDDLASVPANTRITVIPHWTLGSLFPADSAGKSFIASEDILVPQTQILVADYAGVGTNLPAAATYYFHDGAWRKLGRPATESHDDDIILNNSYFTVRNPGLLATSLTIFGSVMTGEIMVPLATQLQTAQDNPTSIARPHPVSLNDSGLISSGAFAESASLGSLQDKLLVFDNAQVGINKQPAATYYYFNGGWRKLGQPETVDCGNDLLPLGTGFIVQKAITLSGATSFWTYSPNH